MSEFIKRTLTGAAFVCIMLAGILIGPISLFLLLLTIFCLSLYEFYRIYEVKGIKAYYVTGLATGIFALSLVFLIHFEFASTKYLHLLIIPLAGIWYYPMVRGRNDSTLSSITTLAGWIYILLPLSLIPFLVKNELTGGVFNPALMIGILAIIWTNDTGAYLTGVNFGKHKMAPSISPKKSWEGFFGGMILALLVSWIISAYFDIIDRSDWLILGLITVLAGTAGDLFESILKRESGLKDSGKIMPGHGGVLDRFDSLLFIIPFVFIYIYLVKI